MPLRIHLAAHAEAVVAPLTDLLRTPAADPFAAEVIGVPTRGVERWLSQEMAQRLGARSGRSDGVTARVEFRFPGWIVGRALAPPGDDPERDPWRPDASVWVLIDLLERLGNTPELAVLAGHIGAGRGADPDDVRLARRYRTLRHVADLFDRYGMYRPQMVAAWAVGRSDDGDGRPLPDELAWQPHLWRLLRERIGRPVLAERLEDECRRIIDHPDAVELPRRLALVGVSRLPVTYLRVLEAIAARRAIDMFVLHPSVHLWDAITVAGCPPRGSRRADDTTGPLVVNPLLSSWGRDARELQIAIGRDADRASDLRPGGHRSLLGRLQEDIRTNRAPAATPPHALALDDRSVQIHSCHGRARQVEVLRDALMHLFVEDPTLEPRDVAILSPDIEGFAPLIEAAFGSGAEWDTDAVGRFPGPGLRVEIADRTLRASNPVIAVVDRVMAIADDRATLTQVLELAALDPVRRRFGFDDSDLARMEQLSVDAGVRWGLGAADRERFGLGALAANSWRSGVDRMLLGIAVGELGDRAVAGVTPMEGLDTGSIDVVGRLAEFVDRLVVVTERARARQSITAWADAIADAADLLTDVDADHAWQRFQLTDLLGDLVAAAGDVTVDLTPAEMRGIVQTGLSARGASARYRTGRITASSMVPLRGVPHRVVCLLGLDDGVFPRAPGRDGDDITLRDPRVGDRDPRGDDVQQLLDALLAASDAVVITYSGRDERTNGERAPSVPVAELIDVLGRTVAGALDRRVCITHPLQPFDPENFRPGALIDGIVWGFDPTAADGARALAGAERRPAVFLRHPLDAPADVPVDLASLVRFVEHPVREFLRARLGVSLREIGDDLPDGIPVDLDPRGRWSVGDRMLRAIRRGVDREAWVAGELARGTLPPGELGRRALDVVAPSVDEIAIEAAVLQDGRRPRAEPVDVRLDTGRRLVGTVPEVFDELVLLASYSRLGPRLRLRAWVYLLALTAADAGVGYRSMVIGRNPSSARHRSGTAWVEPLDTTTARGALERLIGLYDDGMQSVPTIYPRTSAAWAARTVSETSPGTRALADAWERQFESDVPGENEDPSHVLVLGGRLSFDELWKRHGDALRTAASRLWGDLLAVEGRST
jgi:exodeoxyribonuclease V gamma subunit